MLTIDSSDDNISVRQTVKFIRITMYSKERDRAAGRGGFLYAITGIKIKLLYLL